MSKADAFWLGFLAGFVSLFLLSFTLLMCHPPRESIRCQVGVSHYSPTTGKYIEDSVETHGDTLIVHRRKE